MAISYCAAILADVNNEVGFSLCQLTMRLPHFTRSGVSNTSGSLQVNYDLVTQPSA